MGIFDKIKEADFHLDDCPECGDDNLTGGMIDSTVVCQSCGYETEFTEVNRFTPSKASNQEYGKEITEELVADANGQSVTDDLLRKEINRQDGNYLLDHLDDDEQPHHIIEGQTIDVEGGGDSSSLLGNDRSRKISFLDNRCFTVITDNRVFVVVQQFTGNDERNIPYDSITGIDLDVMGTNKRLTLQTHGRTYHISGTLTEEGECRDALKYIRQRRNEVNQDDNSDSNETNDDPLDKLERLKVLREDGTLSESEFNEKKSELLDRI